MRLMFNGKEYFGPRGPAGPDGSPIGTIISYMGKTAPKDYLVCDGSIYGLSDYPDLAKFFTKQFGSSNYFGGDGAVTFAVPDMRNLFLRGYHGEGEEQLSGDIGVKQEATEIPAIRVGENQAIGVISPKPAINYLKPENIDSPGRYTQSQYAYSTPNGSGGNSDLVYPHASYTVRPVNMAVLYCIKAAESFQAQDVYSMEERRIGTWIDGKPLYRKTFVGVAPNAPNGAEIADISALSLGTIANGYGWIDTNTSDGAMYIPYTIDTSNVCYVYIGNDKNGLMILTRGSSFIGKNFWYTIEYTKATDPATIEPSAATQGGASL